MLSSKALLSTHITVFATGIFIGIRLNTYKLRRTLYIAGAFSLTSFGVWIGISAMKSSRKIVDDI